MIKLPEGKYPMSKTFLLLSLVAVYFVILSGCSNENKGPAPKEPAPQVETQKPGNIVCTATLDGKPPAMDAISMSADKKCLAMHNMPAHFQSVIVNDKGMLRNVFVYIKKGLESQAFHTPAAAVEIDQKGCMYEPHVLGIQVNQPLLIVNSDPVLHNIHALPAINKEFNIAQPIQGMKMEKTFTEPEIMVRVKCEVHSWMNCYIGVVNNPFYAVTDSNGACQLNGIPPGEYVVSAWHEKYGTIDQNVTIQPGSSGTIDFKFTTSK